MAVAALSKSLGAGRQVQPRRPPSIIAMMRPRSRPPRVISTGRHRRIGGDPGLFACRHVIPAKLVRHFTKRLRMSFDEWRDDRQSFPGGAGRIGMSFRLREGCAVRTKALCKM